MTVCTTRLERPVDGLPWGWIVRLGQTPIEIRDDIGRALESDRHAHQTFAGRGSKVAERRLAHLERSLKNFLRAYEEDDGPRFAERDRVTGDFQIRSQTPDEPLWIGRPE